MSQLLLARASRVGYRGVRMVSHCINPTCHTELKKLTTGSLYAFEKRSANTEFFWLCSTCVPLVDLFLDLTGTVTVGRRFISGLRMKPSVDRQLRLVYSALERRPWQRAGVARESTLETNDAGGLPSSLREAV